jgi:hypothetical protein
VALHFHEVDVSLFHNWLELIELEMQQKKCTALNNPALCWRPLFSFRLRFFFTFSSSGFSRLLSWRFTERMARHGVGREQWAAAADQLTSFVSLSMAEQELKESFNYGLFYPPSNGRAGKFLDDERPLSDYPFNGPLGYLEVSYKNQQR